MLCIEVEKVKFPGGHIEIMLFVAILKNRITWRPYINYASYRDRNTRIRFPDSHMEIMKFIDVETLEITDGHIQITISIEIETQ